ncbi:MAG TPA: tetratricopeptide repeat protein [Saprospiraceae bacterium]|mgnify:FL=1|nr:tetratricopeptide repeat protein [Saprospiraceae bacterium]
MAKRFYQFNKDAQSQNVRGKNVVQGTGNQSSNEDDEIIDLAEVTHQAQDFYEKYQTLILSVILGLAIAVGGYFVYKFMYMAPKEKAAIEAIYQAENQFAQDSFALALENPGGGFEGFLDIIDNYGGTNTANTAKYYAGICYLNLGKYESAIEQLEDYSPKDKITPAMKFGALGDAYAESGDLDKALSLYAQASETNPNDVITPYYLNKLGMLQFKQGKNDEAMGTLKKIVSEYPASTESREAEKLISRLDVQ